MGNHSRVSPSPGERAKAGEFESHPVVKSPRHFPSSTHLVVMPSVVRAIHGCPSRSPLEEDKGRGTQPLHSSLIGNAAATPPPSRFLERFSFCLRLLKMSKRNWVTYSYPSVRPSVRLSVSHTKHERRFQASVRAVLCNSLSVVYHLNWRNRGWWLGWLRGHPVSLSLTGSITSTARCDHPLCYQTSHIYHRISYEIFFFCFHFFLFCQAGQGAKTFLRDETNWYPGTDERWSKSGEGVSVKGTRGICNILPTEGRCSLPSFVRK